MQVACEQVGESGQNWDAGEMGQCLYFLRSWMSQEPDCIFQKPFPFQSITQDRLELRALLVQEGDFENFGTQNQFFWGQKYFCTALKKQ